MKTPVRYIRLTLLGLCATSFICLQAARADDGSTNAPPHGPPPGGPHDRHFPPAFDQLDLTDAQKAQIQQIIKQTDEERRQQIMAVLTPEQQAKLQQIIAAHKAHDGGGDNPPPPPPPSDSSSNSNSTSN